MSNQMIINFAKKHISDLRQELSDWERILEVYENEGEMCVESNNTNNTINPNNHINPRTPLSYTLTHALLHSNE